MKKTSLLIVFFAFVLVDDAKSNPGDTLVIRKKYSTQRLNGTITLDGIPNEPAWEAVEWGGDFTQFEPKEGNPPSFQTNFKILYDDKFLYIGYRCFDNAP